MFRALADHGDKLGPVIEGFRRARSQQWMHMRHDRVEGAHEQGWEFRQIVGVAAFPDMFEVVEAEADDLAGLCDRQRIGEGGERTSRRRRRAFCEIGKEGEIAGIAPQHGAEIARQSGIDGLKVDRLIALDEAKPRPALRCKSDDFHGSCPVVCATASCWVIWPD